jgi:hypothetical protein
MVGKRLVIPYTIVNHGANDRDTEVSLLIGSETVNSVNLSVPAGESLDGTFETAPDRAGFLTGAIQITDRNLTLDNRRNFTVSVCENIRVLLLETDVLSRVRPFHFLKLALDPSEGEALNGIQTEQGFVQELSQNQLEQYHVVVLSNPDPLSPQTATLLTRYMNGGGTVVLFAGANFTASTLAAFQEERLSSILGERQESDFSTLTFNGPLAALNELLQMDLFKGQRFYTFNTSPSAVIMAVSRGTTLLAEEKVGAGALIACAFSSRRDMCNWPELKSYPIAMIHLFTYAAHDPQRNTGIDCGQLLRLTPITDSDKQLLLSHSNGSSFPVSVEQGEAVFADTWQPGVVNVDRATPRSVALNPVPSESVLTGLSALRLTSIVKGKVNLLKTDAALASQLRNTRQGSDLTGLFLFLLMFLLLLEIIIGNHYLLRPSR